MVRLRRKSKVIYTKGIRKSYESPTIKLACKNNDYQR
jgi:hypothetical protein